MGTDPNKWFSPTVQVRTERVGLIYQVNSVRTAAERLLEWGETGPKWRVAIKTCMAAMEDKKTPAAARKAFVAAAEEAGMLVGGTDA